MEEWAKKGEILKIRVKGPHIAETMWCEVVSAEEPEIPGRRVTVKLDNHPLHPGLSYGDLVEAIEPGPDVILEYVCKVTAVLEASKTTTPESVPELPPDATLEFPCDGHIQIDNEIRMGQTTLHLRYMPAHKACVVSLKTTDTVTASVTLDEALFGLLAKFVADPQATPKPGTVFKMALPEEDPSAQN